MGRNEFNMTCPFSDVIIWKIFQISSFSIDPGLYVCIIIKDYIEEMFGTRGSKISDVLPGRGNWSLLWYAEELCTEQTKCIIRTLSLLWYSLKYAMAEMSVFITSYFFKFLAVHFLVAFCSDWAKRQILSLLFLSFPFHHWWDIIPGIKYAVGDSWGPQGA